MISLPGFKKPQAPNGHGQQSNGSAKPGSEGNGAPRYATAALEAMVERAERAAKALESFEALIDRGE